MAAVPPGRRSPADDRPDPAEDTTTPDPFAGPEWSSERTDSDGRVRERVRLRRRRRGLRRLVAGRTTSAPGRRRSTRRRVVFWSGGLVVAVVIIALAWLAYTALRVRSDLRAVRDEVHSMRTELDAGNLAAAETSARAIRSHADSAHSLSTGPVW